MKLREIEIFRPYDNDSGVELLWAAGASDAQVDHWMSAELVRIAKLGSNVVGMYAMQPPGISAGDGLTFCLRGVIIEPGARKQGLGRWLVGHAIGVAESKGGRHLLFEGNNAKRFFARIGFVADPRGQRFDLIQE